MAETLTLSLDSGGDVVIKLRADLAPGHVARIAELAGQGFYDGVVFHRVIPGFMAQGGGFAPDMSQKPTRANIPNEADNGLGNARGTIAMARTSDPHSASAQFFINVSDNAGLNHSGKNPQGWGYAVFGKVAEGMDVVDKIKGVTTRADARLGGDVPVEPVTLQSAAVE